MTLGTLVRELATPQFVVAHTTHAGGLVLERHAHEFASLTLTVAGAVTERVDGIPFQCAETSLVFKPPGAEHSNEYTRHTYAIIVQVMPEMWAGLIDLIAVRTPFWRVGGLQYARLLQLIEYLEGSSCDELGAEHMLSELLSAESSANDAPGRHGRRFDTIAEYIRERLVNPPRLSELSRRFDYNPTALARAFRRQHGVSIGQFVHNCRAEVAIDLIVHGRDSLSSIAMQVGFADQSHLTRIIHRLAATSPARIRGLSRRLADFAPAALLASRDQRATPTLSARSRPASRPAAKSSKLSRTKT